jgi:hypothetical protein
MMDQQMIPQNLLKRLEQQFLITTKIKGMAQQSGHYLTIQEITRWTL